MHLPEFVLSCRSFGCLCCMLSMGMYLIKREITKCKVYFVIKLPHYFFDYGISHSSIWTFIITIFYYTNGCINRASYVISSNVYRSGQFFSFSILFLFLI